MIGRMETWITENQWKKWESKPPEEFVLNLYATRKYKRKRAAGSIITGVKSPGGERMG